MCTEDYAGRLEKDYQDFVAAGRITPRWVFKDIYGTKTVVDWRHMTIMSRYSDKEKILLKLYRGLPKNKKNTNSSIVFCGIKK